MDIDVLNHLYPPRNPDQDITQPIKERVLSGKVREKVL
tara:strand:+ start:210 stop:323 length:114 start_codon:yes stop_codon:yes gene_type:complete